MKELTVPVPLDIFYIEETEHLQKMQAANGFVDVLDEFMEVSEILRKII